MYQMFAASLVANALLIVALIVVIVRAKRLVIEEKLATFAGCIAAITRGLALQDTNARFTHISRGFSALYLRTEEKQDAAKLLLTRASMLSSFRNVTLADTGEHTRLLALQTAGMDDAPGDKILAYIRDAQVGQSEPRDVWSDEKIASAQFVAERKLLDLYHAEISSAPINILG